MQQSRDRMSSRCGTIACVPGALVALVAILFLSVGPASAMAPHLPIVYYVNIAAEGANNGTSWADAFTDLQDALDAAVSGDAIWVAGGTYTPSAHIEGSSDARMAAFILKSGVALYGGFVGNETALDQRSSDRGLTVLSGDIGTAGDNSDNSYHVVYADWVTDAVLDGFTVTLGRAEGDVDSTGGGMVTSYSRLTVSNCIFSDNSADSSGGGMSNTYSTLAVSDCLFSDNRAGNWNQDVDGRGGGMYNQSRYPGGDGSSLIRNCTFTGNSTISAKSPSSLVPPGGGGMYNNGTGLTVDRCTFDHNVARNTGSYGGGMANWAVYPERPTVTNSIFQYNSAFSGGGGVANKGAADILNSTFYRNGWAVFVDERGEEWILITPSGGALFQHGSSARIVDVIFSENVNSGLGAVYYRGTSSSAVLEITNSLFHENVGACTFNAFDGYYGCQISDVRSELTNYPAANINGTLFEVNPLLSDPENGDFHLLPDSPAIDAGVTRRDVCRANRCDPALPDTDFDGDARFVDGDGLAGNAADIGADEYVPTLAELRNLIVGLFDAGQIGEELADVLLGYVDDAQSALDDGYPENATSSLAEMIDWLKALEDTETTELILRKAEAVHGTFD